MAKPSARGILTALVVAGDRGLLSGEIAAAFGSRSDYPSPGQRQRSTNEILRQRREKGQVRKGGLENGEHTYHRVPSYRWFITDAGREYLRQPLPGPSQRVQREERVRQRQEDLVRRQRLAAAAIGDGYDGSTPQCRKTEKIHELRGQGLMLDEIGKVFGLTRERIRQLDAGIRVTPCRCPECQAKQRQAEHDRHQALIDEAIAAGCGRHTAGPQRAAKIRELRDQGLPWTEISQVFGLTPARISAIARRVLNAPAPVW